MSAAERFVLFQAALWLVWLRFLLAILPFAWVRQLVTLASRTGDLKYRSIGTPTPSRIGQLVAAAATRIPGTTCLARALATRVLLCRHRYPAELYIGVNRDGCGKFEAHAWVEAEGKVAIGSSDVTRYKPILKDV